MRIALRRRRTKIKRGFSLIEALIGIAIIGVALLGLAQLFLLSVSNNTRSGEIARATFLAQQELDYLRALTATELSAFPATARGESADETIDINGDGHIDFRRITVVTVSGADYGVKILVFPASAAAKSSATLLAAPNSYRVRAVISSVIVR